MQSKEKLFPLLIDMSSTAITWASKQKKTPFHRQTEPTWQSRIEIVCNKSVIKTPLFSTSVTAVFPSTSIHHCYYLTSQQSLNRFNRTNQIQRKNSRCWQRSSRLRLRSRLVRTYSSSMCWISRWSTKWVTCMVTRSIAPRIWSFWSTLK